MGRSDRGIWVEVVEEREDLSRGARYGIMGHTHVSAYNVDVEGLQDSFSIIHAFADAIEAQLRKTNVAEAEIAFGLKLSGDGRFSVSSTPDKGNYVVKLKWTDNLKGSYIE